MSPSSVLLCHINTFHRSSADSNLRWYKLQIFMSENHERVEVVSCFIPLLGVTVFIFNYKEKIHSQILKWSNGLISVHQTVARVGCAEQSLKTALLQQPSLRWTNCSLFTLWVTECSKWFSSFFFSIFLYYAYVVCCVLKLCMWGWMTQDYRTNLPMDTNKVTWTFLYIKIN